MQERNKGKSLVGVAESVKSAETPEAWGSFVLQKPIRLSFIAYAVIIVVLKGCQIGPPERGCLPAVSLPCIEQCHIYTS